MNCCSRTTLHATTEGGIIIKWFVRITVDGMKAPTSSHFSTVTIKGSSTDHLHFIHHVLSKTSQSSERIELGSLKITQLVLLLAKVLVGWSFIFNSLSFWIIIYSARTVSNNYVKQLWARVTDAGYSNMQHTFAAFTPLQNTAIGTEHTCRFHLEQDKLT
jgi:hypothetical protein